MAMLLTAGWVATAQAAEKGGAAEAGQYAPWIGKYLGEAGKGKDFIQANKLELRLEALLGDNRYRIMVDELHVTTPFEMKEGVLHFNRCRPHACPDDSVDVFIDVARDKISACSQEYDAEWPVWLSEGAAPKPLKGEVCIDYETYEKVTNPENYARRDEEKKQSLLGSWSGTLRYEGQQKTPYAASMTMRIFPNGSQQGTLAFTQTLTLDLLGKNGVFRCNNKRQIVKKSEGEVVVANGMIQFHLRKVEDGHCGAKPGIDPSAVLEGGSLKYYVNITDVPRPIPLKKLP